MGRGGDSRQTDRQRAGRVGGQLIVRVINCVGGRFCLPRRPRLHHLLVLSCLASQRWSKVIPQGRIERKSPEQELTRCGAAVAQDCLLIARNLPFHSSLAKETTLLNKETE